MTSKDNSISGARDRPIAFLFTPDETADCIDRTELLDLPQQKRQSRLAARVDDLDFIRVNLRPQGTKAVISLLSNWSTTIRYDKHFYRECHWIERVFEHFKMIRAIPTRSDQLAAPFLAMLSLALVR